MHVDYVFMVTIKSKTTEEVIKAYLKNVYSVFGDSKYILNYRGEYFISKKFTWLAKELRFIKVYTSPYTPTGNSMTECSYSFLKAS